MNKTSAQILFLLCLISSTLQLQDTEDCQYVPDHCPVWGGTSTPKCRIDDELCNGNMCQRNICTYCSAKLFGCSTDLKGGVNGRIYGVNPQGPYNCQDVQIGGSNNQQFYVHCACGGSCSFHGNWIIYYQRFSSEEMAQMKKLDSENQLRQTEQTQ